MRAALAASGLHPGRLELEITESALLSAEQATLATLRTLKALGIRISLDDFGTGYSSLSQLRSFPFDKIKIDRSFVTEVAQSEQARAIVRAISTLGESLGMTTIAEGVETWEQALQEAHGKLAPEGSLTGATRELQAGLGAFLQTCHEHGVKVGPWRLQHVVPEWTFGDHPTYGAMTIAHWVCKDGQPWKVGIGLFLGRGTGKPRDLETKLSALAQTPQPLAYWQYSVGQALVPLSGPVPEWRAAFGLGAMGRPVYQGAKRYEAEPDVILAAAGLKQEQYDALAAIAPTIVPEAPARGEWEAPLHTYAEALGADDELTARLDAVTERA